MKSKLKYFFLSTVFVALSGCYHAQRLSNENISSLYNISDSSPLPFYSLYQFASDSLRLFFTIPERSVRKDASKSDAATYRLHVSLFAKNDRNNIVDSATYIFRKDIFLDGTDLQGSIDLFTGEPAGKTMSVILEDTERSSSNEQLFVLTFPHPPGKYHYMLFDENGNPLTSRHITTSTGFSIESSIIRDQNIRVRYYGSLYPLALPPHSVVPIQQFNYRSDSIFDISFRNGKTEILRFSRPGIYHITADTNSRTGYTVFVREEPFPWITLSSQMVEPLRYITSIREYEAIVSSADPKEAVDRFWVSNAGNELRARRLVREYYRRVEKANYLFTSYQDGWRTDRGMIYILYGPPSIVQRGETSEIWTYGESRHLMSLTFIFVKLNNPFTDNDYMLERSAHYKTGWHQIVNSWRR